MDTVPVRAPSTGEVECVDFEVGDVQVGGLVKTLNRIARIGDQVGECRNRAVRGRGLAQNLQPSTSPKASRHKGVGSGNSEPFFPDILNRSVAPGKSRKNKASSRSARVNSGGRRLMSFAVPMKNTSVW